ncbi:hypothetical protein BUALT_Bualt04G0021800 [Buddleja alternifolia]|uniref:Uncharacterized protein n=1 Tax=Buddleja alternifolia TaxID=168488 RepID=A0AAV6XMJ3_9LAMI|nr:hypothetical protein BUALT_Bualt04G0021800 [Buddleja alternifolia]
MTVIKAFLQMRLSEASAHLGSFAIRFKEELPHSQPNWECEGKIGNSWISSTAVKATDATLLMCPSPYEKRCLLRLLAATDFADTGSTATRYGHLCWKIDMAEPSLRRDDFPLLGNETYDDASLFTALENNGLNPWLQNGRYFCGMSQKRGLLCGATAKHFSSDIPSQQCRYIIFHDN